MPKVLPCRRVCMMYHGLSVSCPTPLGPAGIRESQIFAVLSAGHYIYVFVTCIDLYVITLAYESVYTHKTHARLEQSHE